MVQLLLDPVQVVGHSYIDAWLIAEPAMLTPRDDSIKLLDTCNEKITVRELSFLKN